ncbi:MAG: hypothetical protein OEZ65_10650 [Gemmatimonadota bacterium]|nr:hypothetical protein [Gemmatimonadota bacterium]MDH5760037.1 hypothetical protein [Gemmatimonadota bacterium]
MKHGTIHGLISAVMAATMLGSSTAALSATQAESGDGDATTEVRVVNTHARSVQVYARDGQGHRYLLGWVSRGNWGIFELPESLTREGSVQILVFPAPLPPDMSMSGQMDGISSGRMVFDSDEAIDVWVGTDLMESVVQVTST